MSLRSRIAVIIAGSIAVTVAGLAVLTYVFVSAQVNGGLDRSLHAARDDLVRQQADGDEDEDDPVNGLPSLQVKTRPEGPAYFVQLVAADGSTSLPAHADGSLPVDRGRPGAGSRRRRPFVYRDRDQRRPRPRPGRLPTAPARPC